MMKMANILVLVGSPRAKGNTEILADAFIKGATKNGNNAYKVNLRKLKINGCLGCRYCIAHDGKCVLRDDMDQIYPLIDNADMIVFATPVYFYTMSAQIKAVIDRLYAKHNFEFKITTCALLAVAADDGDVFEPLISTYEHIVSYLKWENVGMVTVNCVSNKGDILGRDELKLAEQLGESIT